MSIKISELTPKGANLEATDLLEISESTADGYSSKSITGAEIITAAQEGLQPTLVSGTNIKTINSTSLLGSGDVAVQSTLVSGTNIKTINGNSLLGSGDLVIGGGGLTIGTTAITSGTIGRVLFEGTGNVVQESSQLSWNNTTNALTITTGKTFSAYQSSQPNDALKITASNDGAVFGVQNSNSLGFSGIEYLSNTGVARVFTGFNNGNGQEFRFNNFATGGYIDFLISTSALRIANTRNILIGTTTDAGYKLDVNGTARVQNTLTVTSSSSNGALSLTQNSVGFAAQYIYRPNVTNAIASLMFQDLKSGANSKSFSLGIGRSGDPQWTNSDFIFGFYSGSGGWQQSAKIFNASGNWAIENGTGTSDIATAILQVNSTTKGFLPPRMTNAQMVAIATPASGLMVYDTTNNKMCVYDGTAWQNLY